LKILIIPTKIERIEFSPSCTDYSFNRWSFCNSFQWALQSCHKNHGNKIAMF